MHEILPATHGHLLSTLAHSSQVLVDRSGEDTGGSVSGRPHGNISWGLRSYKCSNSGLVAPVVGVKVLALRMNKNDAVSWAHEHESLTCQGRLL